MSMITLFVLAIVAVGILVLGVRAVMTRALEHDHSFRTDLDGTLQPPVTRESA